VALCWVPEHREGGPDLRGRDKAHAFRGSRVYRYASCPVAVVEQDIDEQPTHRVAHNDRGSLQLGYDALVVLDDGGHCQRLDRGGVLVQRLDLYLEARVGWGDEAVASAPIALDPVLPAAGGHPEAWISTMVSGVLAGSGVFTVMWSS
jgi:hypothetical protein